MANKFKKHDQIKVISGKYKGRTGKILKVMLGENKVLVEGVQVVKRHTKPNKLNPEGGIVQKEMLIDASKVMHLDPKTNTVTRIGFKFVNDKKVRYSKKSGELIDNKEV
jgi:large subunit ribosomal protein L24